MGICDRFTCQGRTSNDRCDAIVATAIVGNDRPAAFETGVIEFLNSDTIAKWAEVAIGL